MTTNVYQIIKTEAHVAEINRGGWGSTEWDKDYMDMTFAPGESEDVAALLDRVVSHGLVRHTKTIASDDLDEVFAIGNGMGDESKIEYVARGKSISVGDIIVDAETGVGHIVDSFGFIGVSPALTAKLIEALG